MRGIDSAFGWLVLAAFATWNVDSVAAPSQPDAEANGDAEGSAPTGSGRATEAEPQADTSGAARVQSPKPRGSTDVAYPEGVSGDAEVVLELLVRADGSVGEAVAISGPSVFDEAARRAALSWQFEPARSNGVAVAARIRFLVRFEQPPPDALATEAGAVPSEATASGAPAQEASGDTPPTDETDAAPSVDVDVHGERRLGSARISRATARQLPGAFGNPLRAIETLPGVTPTLSGAPYFYVRGAPPGNLGYFLDGIRLPALFHVLAGPSVVHPAMIDEVEFYAGPYPARHGRFAGGIAAGTLRPPTYELHGEANVRAFDSSGFVEMPVGNTTSLTLGGRYSYADPIAQLFAPNISVKYWDYQAVLSHELSSRDGLQLFSFGSFDSLTEEEGGERRTIFGAEFHRVQLRYLRQLERGFVRVASLFGWDRSTQREGEVVLQDTLAQVRVDAEHALADDLKLGAGADSGHDAYSLSLGDLDDDEARRDYLRRFPSRVDSAFGLYASLAWDATKRVHLQTGLRSDAYHADGDVALGLSPRVAAEYSVTDGFVLLNAFGIADQPPSNPFPMPGANPALGEGLQRALQSSAGFRWATPLDVALEMTVYQSVLLNLTDGPGISRIDNADDAVDEQSRSIGSSRGLEVLLRRATTHRFGGYLAYTLSSSRRSVGRAEGPSLFDRRHVLSGAVSGRLGRGYSAGLRGTFYTGVPADVAYLKAARRPPRTPPFYRLDLRGEKRFRLGSSGAYWALVLEVLNTTLHKEVLGMSCNAYTCREDEVGPVTVPSIGVEAVF